MGTIQITAKNIPIGIFFATIWTA